MVSVGYGKIGVSSCAPVVIIEHVVRFIPKLDAESLVKLIRGDGVQVWLNLREDLSGSFRVLHERKKQIGTGNLRTCHVVRELVGLEWKLPLMLKEPLPNGCIEMRQFPCK